MAASSMASEVAGFTVAELRQHPSTHGALKSLFRVGLKKLYSSEGTLVNGIAHNEIGRAHV